MHDYDRRAASAAEADDAKIIRTALAAVTKAAGPLDALEQRWQTDHSSPKNMRLLDEAVTSLKKVHSALYVIKLDLG